MSDRNFETEGFHRNEPTANHGGVAAVEEPSRLKHGRRLPQGSRREEISSVTFNVLPARTGAFVFKILSAVGFAALGGFLASEIPHTPGLMTNLIVLSTLSFLGATAMITLAIHNALGRIVVDDNGITFLPKAFGNQVAWCDVAAWRLSDDGPDHQLMFWVGKETFPKLFEIGWLNQESRSALRKVLVARLGEES